MGTKYLEDPKAFLEHNSDLSTMHQDIDQYNLGKDRKILVVFDDMIAEKVLPLHVTELFIWGWKMNIALAFLTQSYFKVPKDIRINCTHYYLIKIGNRAELRAIADRHSKDILYHDFVELYHQCTSKPHSFMIIDTTLSCDDLRRFRRNFEEDCWEMERYPKRIHWLR